MKRAFLRLFSKAGRGRACVNGTRACIHAEIMEIDGDDLRGEAPTRRADERKRREGRKEGIERAGDPSEI